MTPTTTARRMTGFDWTELTLLSLLWGATFIFAKLALAEIAPLTLAFCRVGLAALLLAAALRAAGVAPPRGRTAWAALAIMGLINNALPFGLIFLGQSLMPATLAASLAAILNATTPLFVVLVAHVATSDEKATGPRLAGAVVGFSGVAAMLAPRLAAGPDAGAPHLVAGMICCLIASLLYAFAGVFGRRFARLGVQPLQVAFGQCATATLWLAPVAAVLETPWAAPAPGPGALAALLALASVSTAFAFILYFRLLARAGATNLLLVTLLIPVSAIALGVALLGERLGPEHLAGMAGIALGLALIDGRAPAALIRAARRTA